ncbi:MAG: DEAD/DEAH box helicase [Hyphomicrobiales bacterium]|nr:DEAD/DEAH box helicase [Hyphomicrobiales bacterium]
MTSFKDFGLSAPILAALAREGYSAPTPIQAQAIPHLMQGRDLLGIAQTGTGKTAAFALPLIHRLMEPHKRTAPHSARTLVLAPTRELASQIAESFKIYAGDLPISVEVVFGGVSIGRQERALFRGVDVLVATPGRLLDLIDRGSCRLDLVEALVLDEADQMLDLGFVHALKRIAKLVPKKRHTLLFSATMPKQIASLAEGYLTDPVRVAVTPVATTAERVAQHVVPCETRLKQAMLEHLLSDPAFDRVIVFTRTKHGADRVVKHLDRAGIDAAAIHGNKSQPQRERALAAFRDGQIGVLVATDIAARGIDIDGVSHVVNFELPNIPESYVHRIGRTARAGAKGSAVSFCNREEEPYLRDIEKLIRAQIPRLSVPKEVQTRAAEIGRMNRAETEEAILPSRAPRHHAGRPDVGRRGEGHAANEGERNQARGGKGPRGPREQFRARAEGPAAESATREPRRGEANGRPQRSEGAAGGRRFDASGETPRSRAGAPTRKPNAGAPAAAKGGERDGRRPNRQRGPKRRDD